MTADELKASLSEEQRDALVEVLRNATHRSYRESGYRLVMFNDKSIGVLKASNKMIRVVNDVQAHFMVAIGAAQYADEEPTKS